MKKILFHGIMIALILASIETMSIFYINITNPFGSRNHDQEVNGSGLFSGVDVEKYNKEGRDIWKDLILDPYRGYRPSANYVGEYFNTDELGFRKTVQHAYDQGAQNTVKIAFFGGSTMWGAGSAGDDATIPSRFSAILNSELPGRSYFVANYGVGGYQNAQELITLIEQIRRDRIDVAVFYDWVNESLMGYREMIDGRNTNPWMQPSTAQLNAAAESHLKSQGGIFNTLLNLKKASQSIATWRLIGHLRGLISAPHQKSLEKSNAQNGEMEKREKDQIDRIIRMYRQNKTVIEALGREYGFKPVFVIQPNLYTKKNLSEYEQKLPYLKNTSEVGFVKNVYDDAKKAFSREENVIDLTNVFSGQDTIFIDDCHMTKTGNSIVSEEIFKNIKRYLQ